MPDILQDGELLLYGFVGDSFWGEGFTDREVLDALAEIGRSTDVTVRINSGGGYVDHGTAIYNALTAHQGKVTILVDGIAASSASLIAMAGDEIIMRKGTLMMIHDPSTIAYGTVSDLDKAKTYLDKTAAQMAGIYADRAGGSADDMRAAMKDELWMTASEAVDQGFADSADGVDAVQASAFDYGVYAHAPETLTALASANRWSLKAEMRRSKSNSSAKARATKAKADTKPHSSDNQEEHDMSDFDKGALQADAKKAGSQEAQARMKAIMTSEDSKGREALASHFAYETDMPADAAIAALKAAPKAAEPAPATATAEEQAAAYEAARLRGQAAPHGDKDRPAKAKISASEIYAKRRVNG